MPSSRVEIAAFDFIDMVAAASTVDTVYDLLATEVYKFGFTNFLITDMPPPSLGLESHLILNGWSQAWTERYMEQGFYSHDPMAKKTRERVDPFFWHEVDDSDDRSAKAQQVMNEAAEFGLKYGFSVPIYGVEGEQSCVTMGGDQLDIPPRGREAIHLISIYAHHRARTLRHAWSPPASNSHEHALTLREREVLKWVALGKTDWEIGKILKISEETSYAHVRNSCRKLKAATRTQAVVKAMLAGDILL